MGIQGFWLGPLRPAKDAVRMLLLATPGSEAQTEHGGYLEPIGRSTKP